jgi:hypothetical protein
MAFLFLGVISIQADSDSCRDDKVVVKVSFDDIRQIPRLEDRFERLDEPIGLFGYFAIPHGELSLLDSFRIRYEIESNMHRRAPLVAELDSFYYTYAEMVDTLSAWQIRYPELAHIEVIGTTQQEQRNIYAIKISDSVGVDQDEPVVLLDGTHHACEIMGMEICMAFADTLLNSYGIDGIFTRIVDSAEIWIVPLINPDGNSAVHSGISLNYRKNGRDLDGDGNLYEYDCNDSWQCPTEGVDLNRNYSWYWSNSGSPVPMNYYYRGPSAGSESENAAITSLVARIKPVFSVTYHSWGEVLYYPWQWSDNSYTPDQGIISFIANTMAGLIEREDGTGSYYSTPTGGQAGMAPNWQYARHGVISFLPETVQYPDFIPDTEARKDAIVRNNLQGVLYLFSLLSGSQITGHIHDARTHRPLSAEVRILENYSELLDPRMSDSLYGRYTRILMPGTYTVEVVHPDHPTITIPNVDVAIGTPTILDVWLGLLPGDANGSGIVNGLDVVFLVNYLKGQGPAPDPIQLGDANGDCVTNGSDVVYMVNYFKGGSALLACPY